MMHHLSVKCFVWSDNLFMQHCECILEIQLLFANPLGFDTSLCYFLVLSRRGKKKNRY